jgi:bromodomain-containing protein 8
VSYVDPSSSEFTDSDEEDEPVSKRRRTTQYPGKKGSKRNLTMKSEVESWPEISMRAITDVTNEILRRLRELDQEGTFALPVVEAFPYLSKDYKRVIKEPMDFRTIEEDRLPVYRSIRELQKDLVLVFTNCIKFNEQGSELASFARVMLDSMDDIFHAVCEEQGVRMRSS